MNIGSAVPLGTTDQLSHNHAAAPINRSEAFVGAGRSRLRIDDVLSGGSLFLVGAMGKRFGVLGGICGVCALVGGEVRKGSRVGTIGFAHGDPGLEPVLPRSLQVALDAWVYAQADLSYVTAVRDEVVLADMRLLEEWGRHLASLVSGATALCVEWTPIEGEPQSFPSSSCMACL